MAVALSLLAMHQLSSNHAAAGPTASAMAVLSPTVSHHVDHQVGGGGTGHAHLFGMPTDAPSALNDGACPNCAEHSAMALTCLAVSLLLAFGWVLNRPVAWRGVWLPRLLLRAVTPPGAWLPWPRSLTELSISRT